MARRGRVWGNALGGWRKQPRAKDGTFGSGRTSRRSPKRSVRTKKSVRTRSSSSKTRAKSTAPAARKKWSKKKKAAVAAGVVVGTGAALYGSEYLVQRNEFRRSGGHLTTTDLGGGVSATTVRRFKMGAAPIDPVAVNDLYNSEKLAPVLKNAAKIWRPSLRPQIHSITYLHSGDELLGYSTDVVKGRNLKVDNLYLRPSARGNRRVISAMTKNAKARQEDFVSRPGRRIVISKYRSEDSERVVRNQARRLGKSKVKVEKRYNPTSDFAKEIKSSMDTYFATAKTTEFKKVRAGRVRAGVVI